LDDLNLKLENMIKNFEAKYIEHTRIEIFTHEFPWNKLDYSSSASILETAMPTEPAIKMLAVMSKHMSEMDEIIQPIRIMEALIYDIFLNVKSYFS
jgi:hypothetical protein